MKGSRTEGRHAPSQRGQVETGDVASERVHALPSQERTGEMDGPNSATLASGSVAGVDERHHPWPRGGGPGSATHRPLPTLGSALSSIGECARLDPQLRGAASDDPPKDGFIVPEGFVTCGGAGDGSAMTVIEPPLRRKYVRPTLLSRLPSSSLFLGIGCRLNGVVPVVQAVRAEVDPLLRQGSLVQIAPADGDPLKRAVAGPILS